jgi:hypothetical protein
VSKVSDIMRVLLLDVLNVRKLRVDIHGFLGVVWLQSRGHVVTSRLVVRLYLFARTAHFTRWDKCLLGGVRMWRVVRCLLDVVVAPVMLIAVVDVFFNDSWFLHRNTCSCQELTESGSILHTTQTVIFRLQAAVVILTRAIRSVGSRNGSLFQLTFSALRPFRFTIPFSQLAQSTGPTYFFVNIPSSSTGCLCPDYNSLINSNKFLS